MMGLIFRRRATLSRLLRLNISTKGISLTGHLGRISINTRGRNTIRIGHGLSIRKQQR